MPDLLTANETCLGKKQTLPFIFFSIRSFNHSVHLFMK